MQACWKEVLTPSPPPKMGWAWMSFSKVVSALDFYIRSGDKRKEALKKLLQNGRISVTTFDFMEKQVDRVAHIALDLKETLEKEEAFWKDRLSEKTRILESVLVELELRYRLGEIGEEYWKQRSRIISLGLDSARSRETTSARIGSEPALPIQTKLEEHSSSKVGAKLETEAERESLPKDEEEECEKKTDRQSFNKRKRVITKEPSKLESPTSSRVHCMNPWKPDCRSSDIELSIYYNGRMTPICQRCWEDISKNNTEWSSL